MSFFSKVRILVGALVHAPFTPGPERAESEEEVGAVPAGSPPTRRDKLEKQAPATVDEGRVADLIEKRKERGEP